MRNRQRRERAACIPTSSAAKRRYLKREMRRLYRAMRQSRFRVEVGWFRSRSQEGVYVGDGGAGAHRIRVNPFRQLVSIFVHELYHHLDLRASEASILERERFVRTHLSLRQQQRLFQNLRRLWIATVAERRRRGKHIPSCPLCGRTVPREP